MRVTARTAAGAVVAAAALFLGAWAVGLGSSPDAVHEAPFERPGRLGEPVSLRTGDLTVRAAQAGDRLIDAEWGRELATTGAWVVVDYRMVVRTEAQLTAGATLVDASGRVYGATGAGCGLLQPAIPRACSLAFEVPTDALGAELTLRFPASRYEEADDVAVVSLGVLPASRPSVELAKSRYVTAEQP